MEQKHKCPHCGTVANTTGMQAGEVCQCKACGRDFSIPESVQSAEPIKTAEPVSGPGMSQATALKQPLASRGDRLLARLIDWAISVVLGIPAVIAIVTGGMIESGWFLGIGIAMALLFNLVYFIFQAYWLTIYGQTIGKRIMHIKIVMHDTGKNGGFVPNVLLREILNTLIGIIIFYELIDILFIFSQDQRCIHDHIAGTRVVVA